MPVEHILPGSQIETMSEPELAEAAGPASVLARLAPAHKERIIHALKSQGHVLGFLGDGINDAPTLKAADVSVSVDGAVDIAKESSDIILLENNLPYDFSQTTIPTDKADSEWLAKPRQWTIDKIFPFILFIGPISSIFDYVIFLVLPYVFEGWHNPALFHTGWFVGSLFTQTLIIHVIRTNKIPFVESRASWPLMLSSLIIVAIGVGWPFHPSRARSGSSLLHRSTGCFWPSYCWATRS